MPILSQNEQICKSCASLMARLKLTERQWRLARDYLPGREEDPGRTGFDNRMSLEGMIWVARCGSPWRDLPYQFGDWNSVYWRFRRWARSGVFDRLFASVLPERDLTSLMVDGTFAKAHQHAAGALKPEGETAETSKTLQKIGRSSGGFTTKLIAVVSIDGGLVDFSAVPGNAAEVHYLIPLVAGVEGVSEVIADRAYDSQEIRDAMTSRQIAPVIPGRSHRKEPIEYCEERYQKRHLIENYFSFIKHYRGVATRYCKLAETYVALVKLAAWEIATR